MYTTYLKTKAVTLALLAMMAGSMTSAFGGESDPIVAIVDNQPIRLSYVYQHIEALSLGDQIDVRDQIDRFTESVIQEQMLFQYALHQLNKDAEFREEIKTVVLSHLIEKYVKSRIDVSDRLVETYYREHQNEMGGEHWRVHHIPLDSAAQCEALMAEIASLERFIELAREHSTDPVLAGRGGDMGYVMRQHNVLGLGEGLSELSLNKTHRIDNRDGCNLIWISEYLKSPIPALDEVRERISQILVRQQEISLLNTLLESAAKAIVSKRYSSASQAD